MERFTALLIEKPEGQTEQSVRRADLTLDDLMPGDTLVAVEHTTLNYKDALALTGRSPVVRRFPMIPGIDLSGAVLSCETGAFAPGDKVLLNSFGLGEVHYGAYAGRARVKAEWLMPHPKGFSGAEAMAIGTAGYTAALSVAALRDAGIMPEAGPILVTGAAGGVGSVALSLLSALGYAAIASTGRPEEEAWLRGLGASDIIPRAELSMPGKPLGKMRFAGAIDSVGSHTLANALAQTQYGGAVTSCGLAQGPDLPMTVMPFILRAVRLIGIDAVMAPMARRRAAWDLLDAYLDRQRLAALSSPLAFDDLIDAAPRLLDGRIRGRVTVEVPH